MTERSPNIELTTFCKNFGRDQKVWSDAIGSEVTSADGRFKILKIMQSSTGTVEGVWISSLSGDDYFTINNLQAKFRSITLTEKLYLKLFKPSSINFDSREVDLRSSLILPNGTPNGSGFAL